MSVRGIAHLGAGFLVVLAACGGERAAPPATLAVSGPDSATLARARSAADALGQDLLGLLTGALERGGPMEGIVFCSDSAQARTARHAAEGVTLHRVSLRVRNPANRPDEWERQLLAVMAQNHADGRGAEVLEMVTAADGSRYLQYLRPIVVAERCLACHGDPAGFPVELRRRLADRYPSDSATGYKVGDFRGAISVVVPAAR